MYTHDDMKAEYYGKGIHVDSTLAPRLTKNPYGRTADQRIVFTGSIESLSGRQDLHYRSEECPQGWFLRHELDNGFTAVAWWDRTQGDHRSGINSNILLEGVRTSTEVLEAGRRCFPRVFDRLAAAGVWLVEVFPS